MKFLLSSAFSLQNFQSLCGNILNLDGFETRDLEKSEFPENEKIESITQIFTEHLHAQNFGIFVVQFSKNTSLSAIAERRKTAQKLLGMYENGFFAFVAEGNLEEWKFSLVNTTHKTLKEFSLGTQNPTKTAEEQLKNFETKKDFGSFLARLGKIAEAFSVEATTKKFYAEIQQKFFELVGAKTDKKTTEGVLHLPSVPKENHKAFQDFAVRLFGRIVFCWFLKKKKFENSNHGLIPEEILSKKAVENFSGYYHSILEPLFFETLNKPIPERKISPNEFFKKIPFLNGGLFSPHDEDFYEKSFVNILNIPDFWFLELFEIFEHYNFTIDENSNLEAEVAIDPEMLGRIFENLLAEINPETGESARKSSGSFYTPREIVDYMVEESLQEYLKGKFPVHKRQKLDREKFLELSSSSEETICEFWEKYPSKVHSTNFSFFEADKFSSLCISPRIFLKLKGKFETNIHAEIDSFFWEAFLDQKMEVVSKFFGDPKEVEISVLENGKIKIKKFHFPSLHAILKWEDRFFSAFFTPLFSGKILLNTVFEINESRKTAYEKKFCKVLQKVEKRFDTKEKSSWEDADSLHQTRSLKQLSDKFSAVLQELFSSAKTLSNPYLRVKFGESTALLQEVENIISHTTEESEEKAKTRILDALDTLKILDPACGSGAFPMGILQKVEKILKIVDPKNERWLEKLKNENFQEYEKMKEKEPEYQRKLMIIQKSIFGVDIQEMAVEISRLRFFLSLVVDEKADETQENFGIEPLPNLDFKFVCANSLLPLPDISKGQSDLFVDQEREKIFEEMKKIREEYFTAHAQKKDALKYKFSRCQKKLLNLVISSGGQGDNKMAEYAKKLQNWKPFENRKSDFFDLQWMFGIPSRHSALDAESGGFDIVIGNPPYVKEYTFKKAFDGLRDSPYYIGKMDLWNFFACSGLDLLKQKGIQSFIAPNNWVTNFGAKKMRKKILEEAKIRQFLDFGNYKIFETAGIQTMVYLLLKDRSNDSYPLKYGILSSDKISKDDLKQFLRLPFSIENKFSKKYEFQFEKNLFEDKNFIFNSSDIENITEKFLKNATFFLDEKEVANGIHPHFDFVGKKQKVQMGDSVKIGDGIFALSNEEKNFLNLKENEIEIVKPYFLTPNFYKYFTDRDNHYWIIYTDSKFKNIEKIQDYPNLKKHLDKFSSVITSDNRPYGLHRARDEHFFQGEKIVVARKCTEPSFSYSDFDCYVSATFYVIKTSRLPMKYLLGILNSKAVKFWLWNKGKIQGNNFQIDKDPLVNIPIPQITQQNQETVHRIEELVEEILAVKNGRDALQCVSTETEHLETQIDELVFELYGLTEEEKKVVLGK